MEIQPKRIWLQKLALILTFLASYEEEAGIASRISKMTGEIL
jgi:hypothetical protein